MKWKIFQCLKFLFRHSSNSRKLSRQKFHNELAYLFTAYYGSKNADWNHQQLTDGGVLANRNSANHPYCFLSISFFAFDLFIISEWFNIRILNFLMFADLTFVLTWCVFGMNQLKVKIARHYEFLFTLGWR